MHHRFIFVSLLAGTLGNAGCGADADGAAAGEFEAFRIDWGWGLCIPEADCTGFVELLADGTLRLDTPCDAGLSCDDLPPGRYQAVISEAELETALDTLGREDLRALLGRSEPPCPPPADVSESMTLSLGGVVYQNTTTFCEDAPLAASRALLGDLVGAYFGADAPTLTAAGWSFGECLGACVGELALDEHELRYTIHDWGPDPAPLFEASATLTELGLSELHRALAALRNEALEERYGCPDCADGGASRISLSRAGTATTHTYEYGRPPAVLETLDTMLAAWMDALERCTTTTSIEVAGDCTPREP